MSNVHHEFMQTPVAWVEQGWICISLPCYIARTAVDELQKCLIMLSLISKYLHMFLDLIVVDTCMYVPCIMY